MAGQVQIEFLPAGSTPLQLSHPRQFLWFGAALLCLLSSWYFAGVIAPAGLGPSAPSVQQGLFPEWYGCREILHGRDPYRPAVTRQIELTVYGGTQTGSAAPLNQHRFAYPVFFVFLFFPVAVLSFATAQLAALVVSVLLTAISIALWLPRQQFSNFAKLTFTMFAFATYPVMLGLQLRQPTLIIVSLLAAVFFCVQSRRLVLAGVLAALGASKPQLAIAVLLPLAIWSVMAWKTRKAFLLSLSATLSALLLASELAVPGWFSEWLATVAAYAHYAGGAPLLADLLHGHLVLPASLLLI
ncbi:MAG: glycosyltransferase family 87 protein, partial [Candidatus Korobacteraceae bacterium]